jgi:hypothetical protein
MAKKEVKEKSKKRGFSPDLVGYILGIVAVVQSLFSPLAGIVLGIIGLTFSKKENTALARKAKTLNTIGIILGVIFFVAIIVISKVQLPY